MTWQSGLQFDGNGNLLVALAGISGVSPSGDATGATDTANIQAALNAARVPYGSMPPAGPTAAGAIVLLAPGVYTINAPLRIGSFTTLDARGSVINLLAGTNNNMLQNYGATAVMTSTGSVGAGGNTMSFQNGGSDVMYLALLTVNPTPNTSNPPAKWGASVATAQASGYASNGFTNTTAVGIRNFQYVNSFNQAVFDANWLNNTSNITLTLYYRDVNFHVLGGVWNMGTNGSGSNNATDHCFRFFNCDGFSVEYPTFLSQGNNGLYGISIVNATNFDIGPAYFDVNPGDWTWTPSHLAGFQRDGVHINGPARDGRVFALRGSTGDDLAAITSADFGSISNNITGDVSRVSFEDIRCGLSASGLVKVIAGPGTTVSDVTVKKVTGTAACALYIGDDNRNTATQGGTIDGLICEDVNCTGGTTSSSLVNIAGLGMGEIKLKNFRLQQFAGTTINMIEVGYQPAASNTTPSTVGDLTIDGLNPATLISGNKALNIRSGSTVSKLRYRDWVNPLTNYPLIANAGTVTIAESTDSLPIVNLTGQTAAITSTAAFTPGLSGVYRFTVSVEVTTAGTAGTVTASVITNNGLASQTQTTPTASLTASGAEADSTFSAYCAAGQAINYSTTFAGATGAPQYALRIRAEYRG